MFLNKTIEELKSSNLGGTNIALEQSDLIKKYFKLKFRHEHEAKEFKANQKLDLDNIYETGLFYSCNERKVNDTFAIISKVHYDLPIKTQVDDMFNMLIETFSYVNAKTPYYENEERLKVYWAIKLKAKKDYREFKSCQKVEQKRIRDELLGNGFIPQILNNAYTNIKLSLGNYKELGADLEIFQGEHARQFTNSLELVMTEIFLEEISK